MNDMTMYMITHKPVEFVPDDRTPIFVGKGNNLHKYISDNTGDNISEKNSNYCELTALYWMWKNDKSSNYISIEHYRRFFIRKWSLFPIVCSKKTMLNILNRYDVVTSSLSLFGISNCEYYRQRHYESDMNEVKKAIMKFCPDYIESFESVMADDKLPMFNMFALNKELFDAYCEWLFGILFYVESRIDLNGRTDYQKRVFGFLSERLMEVWIRKNKLKVYRTPVYRYDENTIKAVLRSVKDRIPKRFTPTTPRR